MKGEQVSNHNIDIIWTKLQEEVAVHNVIIMDTQPVGTGKWGMARLWRSWMATTAKFMAANGVKMPLMVKKDGSWYGSRLFNADDAHELFTRQWLGEDEHGNRLSWAKSSNDDEARVATKGERWKAMRDHDDWCLQKGIQIFKPRDSDYNRITEEQNQ